MSFENTSEQVEPTVVNTPVKKRGRPAGAKNKKTKTVGRPVGNSSRLKAELESSKNLISSLKVALDDSRKRHKTEVDSLLVVVSYLENTLKDAWAK